MHIPCVVVFTLPWQLKSHNREPMASEGYLQKKSVNLVQGFTGYRVQSLGFRKVHTSSIHFLCLSWMIVSLISVPNLL